MIFSDGTIAQLTDVGFHLEYLSGMLSWSNLKLLRYASELSTPFALVMESGKPALFFEKTFLDFIAFPPQTDFYKTVTAGGMPFIGNAVLQGLDWVSFQSLWPCEYAAAGRPCEFCFSGADDESRAKKGRPLPDAVSPEDFADVVHYAVNAAGMNSLQITGGSTFDGISESKHITSYLASMDPALKAALREILLYISPPYDKSLIDSYFTLGASRIACSIELWDEALAAKITPGKTADSGRGKYLGALSYIAEKYGPARAFTNFIIGIEAFDSLKAGATLLAERGVLPTAAVWMPMGRPVAGSMKTPGPEYYRRVIALFAELYERYALVPPKTRGLNVCIESDIYGNLVA
jgi:hypothetical protein